MTLFKIFRLHYMNFKNATHETIVNCTLEYFLHCVSKFSDYWCKLMFVGNRFFNLEYGALFKSFGLSYLNFKKAAQEKLYKNTINYYQNYTINYLFQTTVFWNIAWISGQTFMIIEGNLMSIVQIHIKPMIFLPQENLINKF